MFLTFGEKLNHLEDSFAGAEDYLDHRNIICECGNLIEKCIAEVFYRLHTTIEPADKKQLLEFERENGTCFLKHPSIANAIPIYQSLVDLFKNHKWLNPEIPDILRKLDFLHFHYRRADNTTDAISDTDDALYYTESVLSKINFKDEPIRKIAFPLPCYLVYSSIKEKFETAKIDKHYLQIIHDAKLILPRMLNALFDFLFNKLNIRQKEHIVGLIEKYNPEEIFEKQIHLFIDIFKMIDFYEMRPPEGNRLQDDLLRLLKTNHSQHKGLSIRLIALLDSIFVMIEEEHASSILKFADAVKKHFLKGGNRIDNRGKIYLEHLMQDLFLDEHVAERIRDEVVYAIENEIILYQTFHEDKFPTKRVKDEKQAANLFKYACAKLKDKEYKAAKDDLDKLIHLKPEIAFYHIYRGVVNEYLDNEMEAERDFSNAIELNPKKEFYHYNRGLAKFEAEDYYAAISEFDKAIELENRDPDFYYFRGHAKESINDYHAAVADYRKANMLNTKHPDAARSLQKLQQKLEQEQSKKMSNLRTSKELANRLAFACDKLSNNEFQEALKDFNHLISLKDDAAFYYIYRGMTYEYIGEILRAKADFKKALTLNPKKDFYYYNRGMVRYKVGDYKNAYKEFSYAIEIEPNDADYFYFRGLMNEKLAKDQMAISDYLKTLKINNKHPDAMRRISILREKMHTDYLDEDKDEQQKDKKLHDAAFAQTYFDNACEALGEKDYKRAVTELNHAIAIQENMAFYHIYQGIAYRKLNDENSMTESFHKAMAINPNKAMFFFNRGKAEMECKDYEKAIEEFTRAINMEKNFAYYTYRAKAYKKSGKTEQAGLDLIQAEKFQSGAQL